MSKKSGRSVKILWPSQNICTLVKSRKKGLPKICANFRLKRRLSFTKISQLRFEQPLSLTRKTVCSQSKIQLLNVRFEPPILNGLYSKCRAVHVEKDRYHFCLRSPQESVHDHHFPLHPAAAAALCIYDNQKENNYTFESLESTRPSLFSTKKKFNYIGQL